MKFYLIVFSIFMFLFTCCNNNGSVMNLDQNRGSSQQGEARSSSRWLFSDFLAEVDSLQDPQQKMALVDTFMTYASQFGFPLVEDSLAHFLYRGNPSQPFSVAADFNGWQPAVDLFSRVSGTDLYYLSKSFPLDARLDYKFVMGAGGSAVWLLDPLNPYTILGGFGPNSELRMPQWEYPYEIDYNPAIPHGSITDFPQFTSTILNNTRRVQVYTPPGYGQDTLSYPVLFVQDGGEYITLASMPNVLDNLIAANLIKPVIAVFIDPVNRNQEYWLNDNYALMLKDEMVPFIEANFRCLGGAQNRALMGASLGGEISLYTAFLHDSVFGMAAGQSSAIQVNEQALVQMFQNSPAKNIAIYLDWGTFESLQTVNQQFAAILQSKNYELTFNEYNEGHSWGNWRAHIDEVLKTFWNTEITGIF